ncbi:hypothetical protein QYM36_008415, partial [Artemia franciscana]
PYYNPPSQQFSQQMPMSMPSSTPSQTPQYGIPMPMSMPASAPLPSHQFNTPMPSQQFNTPMPMPMPMPASAPQSMPYSMHQQQQSNLYHTPQQFGHVQPAYPPVSHVSAAATNPCFTPPTSVVTPSKNLSSKTDSGKRPTVKPKSNFNATEDCEKLKKAMKGFGCDEKSITSILSSRSNSQRVMIAATYKSLFGKELVKELKGELSGNYEDLVVALMTPLPEYLATELNKAMKGGGTEEAVLIEILCPADELELQDIKEAYQNKFGRSLEEAIKKETSGSFCSILISILQCNRSKNEMATDEQAKQAAEQLYKAGEAKWGTEESTFIRFFANESYAGIRKTDEHYMKKTGHSLEKAIKKEFSGSLRKALKAILLVAHNKHSYFAHRIFKSVKGMGTKEKQLMRIIVTRCEIDLGNIKEQFRSKTGKPLEDTIS